jgi:hypothetical protein
MTTNGQILDLRSRVLLSIQRALVGEITPEMRAIDVEISEKRILVRVFTEGALSDKLREDFDAGAMTQLVADFPEPDKADPQIILEFIRCDTPAPVPVRGVLVFGRVETLFRDERAVGA